jgi:hypothetical protein
MMQVTYYGRGLVPKVYGAREGEAPGTVDLIDGAGDLLVRGLPLVGGQEPAPLHPYAVAVTGPARAEAAPKKLRPASKALAPSATEAEETGSAQE